jgi:hypothetical protein
MKYHPKQRKRLSMFINEFDVEMKVEKKFGNKFLCERIIVG